MQADPHTTAHLGTSALLVIDTQRDFLDGGASTVPGTTQVLPAVAQLVLAYRKAGLPIVHVVRLYDGDDVDLPRRSLIAGGAPIVRPHSDGSQIPGRLLTASAPRLDPELLFRGDLQELGSREWAMWKPRWGAFHRTPLDGHLQRLGVDTVVVAGCNFPNCPRATIYGASERDYRAVIAADAISGVLPLHLDEAGRIGVGHLTAAELVHDVEAARTLRPSVRASKETSHG